MLRIIAFALLMAAPLSAQKLKDGEPAVIKTTLTKDDVTAKIKAYFAGKNLDFTVNPDSGRIQSDWYGERRCGPGFYKCANRAGITITLDGGHANITVQVYERKREAGINEKPWKENSTSKGKQTEELAAELRNIL